MFEFLFSLLPALLGGSVIAYIKYREFEAADRTFSDDSDPFDYPTIEVDPQIKLVRELFKKNDWTLHEPYYIEHKTGVRVWFYSRNRTRIELRNGHSWEAGVPLSDSQKKQFEAECNRIVREAKAQKVREATNQFAKRVLAYERGETILGEPGLGEVGDRLSSGSVVPALTFSPLRGTDWEDDLSGEIVFEHSRRSGYKQIGYVQ